MYLRACTLAARAASTRPTARPKRAGVAPRARLSTVYGASYSWRESLPISDSCPCICACAGAQRPGGALPRQDEPRGAEGGAWLLLLHGYLLRIST